MIWPIIQRILFSLLWLLETLFIARAVLSFVAMGVSHPTFHRIYGVIRAIAEPFLSPIRRLLDKIPFLQGLPIDFSPIVALMILSFIGNVIRWL